MQAKDDHDKMLKLVQAENVCDDGELQYIQLLQISNC
jgi:hypothetical protein